MKGYADELESAFNGLHGRYTKLKEYYTASDANNQVSFVVFIYLCIYSMRCLPYNACSQSSCGRRRTCLNRICVCVLWQVLSKNLLEANELLKSHQTQLKSTQDKMKALEDHLIAGQNKIK